MAKRIPRHIRIRTEASDAILQLAFEIANDTFNQKFNGAGNNLLNLSLAHLPGEVIAVKQQLDSAQIQLEYEQSLSAIVKALSRGQNGRTFLAKQANQIEDEAFSNVLKNLSKGKGRSKKLLGLDLFEIRSGDYVTITGTVIALLALVHSTFNTDEPAINAGEDAFTELKALRSGMELGLYAQCLQGTDPVTLAGTVSNAINDQLPSLIDLVRATRDASVQMRQLLVQGSGGQAETVGIQALRWSQEIRESVTSLASAMALSLGGFTERNAYLTDPEEVAKRAFGFNLPDGKNAAFDNLSQDKLYDVAGSVTAIEVRRKAKHLISTLELTDPPSGQSVSVAMSFVNAHNLGITPQTFFHCTGVFHTKSTLNRNKPAIHISRLPLVKLAKSSWRAGYLQLGSTFMEIWPNDHLASWVIGPHTTTEFEQPGTGAGEILLRLTPNITANW